MKTNITLNFPKCNEFNNTNGQSYSRKNELGEQNAEKSGKRRWCDKTVHSGIRKRHMVWSRVKKGKERRTVTEGEKKTR